MQVDLLFLGIGERHGLAIRARLLQGDLPPHVLVLIRTHHVWVKGEHVVVTDTVGDTVAVQLVTEHVHGRVHLLLVLVLDGRTREAKKHGRGKRATDSLHHVSEGRAMAFVHDEDDVLLAHALQVGCGHATVVLVDVAHLLDGGHNQRICRVIALEAGAQHIGVLRSLNRGRVIGEVAILVERLGAQLDAIHQKHHLVGVL